MTTPLRVDFLDGDFHFNEMYVEDKWEPETKAVLQRFLKPGDLLLDCGAWIGPVALWAADIGATVLAVEPDPVAYEALVLNTLGRVSCIHAAVSPQHGTVSLSNPHMGDSQTRIGMGETEVWTITPADLFAMGIPTLVKCDIEGYEVEVLPALLPLCLEHKVPIYLSWHEPWWSHVPDRTHWFDGFSLEPIRGDGWTGFSELLAIP